METKLTDATQKRALILRLKRVEGQLRGVQQLIENDAPCDSVAQQISAARRALDKAFHHMLGCLIESQAPDGKPERHAAAVRDILARYG